jgi:hypothetical protein
MNAVIAGQVDVVEEQIKHPSDMCESRADALFPDPLEPDGAMDEVVITTRRAIGRVALVASEATSRFHREGIGQEPMAWMLAPRRLFDGSVPLVACLDRDDCLRAILVHGLGLGLNVERSELDDLLAAHDEGGDQHSFRHSFGRTEKGRRRALGAARVRLYTATIVDTRSNCMTQIFHASMARDAMEVRTRLAGRLGPDVAALADIRPGLHISSPPVVALVPGPVVELIRQMEREGDRPHARTFAVDIEMAIQA